MLELDPQRVASSSLLVLGFHSPRAAVQASPWAWAPQSATLLIQQITLYCTCTVYMYTTVHVQYTALYNVQYISTLPIQLQYRYMYIQSDIVNAVHNGFL